MDSIYIWFPLTFAFIGFCFSSRPVLLWFNSLNPWQGMLAYYAIIFVTLEIMQFFGLIVGGVKMQSPVQTIGQLFILFSYFIVFDMESAWVQDVVKEDRENRGITSDTKNETDTSTTLGNQALDCPNIYLQAEDGATFYLIGQYVKNKELQRYITFIGVPFIFSLIGIYLTRGKVLRSMF